MEQKEFRFDEATPLLQFIDRYRDRIVGHTLKACYVDGFLYVKFDGASRPVFLVLDDSCIGIEYLYPGHATIITAEESDFEITGEILNDTRYKMITFHSRIPGRDDDGLLWCSEMPAMNQKITDISIGRHSNKYEDYPNSERPEGGDYFSWIKLTLEDGTELNINAEDSLMDGYVDVWFTSMPAYALINSELDRPASELGLRINNEFDGVVWACDTKPDELADLAMHYMRKCDHEIENYRKENGTSLPHGYNTLYTDSLHHVMKVLVKKGMNPDYVDSSGKPLRDLVLEIGNEASKRVLPLIYTNDRLKDYLDWLDRVISHEEETAKLRNRNGLENIRDAYNDLPEKVQNTSYGEKLKDIKQNGLKELEMHFKAIREYIRPLH